jgi:hypothetical protein
MVMIAGKTGLQAHEELARERDKQQRNLEKLYVINENLTGVRDALKYDDDTIAVYARELGFGSEDERFIRIIGQDSVRSPQMTEGEMVQVETNTFVDDKTLRIIAVCAAGALGFFFLFVDMLKSLFKGEDNYQKGRA